jgi:hypothetical protein
MRIRTLHKWIGVGIGLVLVMWLVTGIVMGLPNPSGGGAGRTSPDVAWLDATLSPADAVRLVREQDTTAAVLNSVTLHTVLDQPVYRVALRRQRGVLISAITGDRITIDRDLAVRIGNATFTKPPEVTSVDRLTAHSMSYPNGRLPAFRIAYDDESSTVLFIVQDEGTVVSTDRRRRTRAALASLHDFHVIRVTLGRASVQEAVLVGTGVVCLVVTLLGYWLALPGRWRRKAIRR